MLDALASHLDYFAALSEINRAFGVSVPADAGTPVTAKSIADYVENKL